MPCNAELQYPFPLSPAERCKKVREILESISNRHSNAQGAEAEEDACQLDQSGNGGNRGSPTSGLVGSDFQKQMEAQTPLGRVAQPEDIAPIAVFLASADSGWLTGETCSPPVACGKRALDCLVIRHCAPPENSYR
jgi:enoyl-ACP reductase-like protein